MLKEVESHAVNYSPSGHRTDIANDVNISSSSSEDDEDIYGSGSESSLETFLKCVFGNLDVEAKESMDSTNKHNSTKASTVSDNKIATSENTQNHDYQPPCNPPATISQDTPNISTGGPSSLTSSPPRRRSNAFSVEIPTDSPTTPTSYQTKWDMISELVQESLNVQPNPSRRRLTSYWYHTNSKEKEQPHRQLHTTRPHRRKYDSPAATCTIDISTCPFCSNSIPNNCRICTSCGRQV